MAPAGSAVRLYRFSYIALTVERKAPSLLYAATGVQSKERTRIIMMSSYRVRRLFATIVLLLTPLVVADHSAAGGPQDYASPTCWVKNTSTGATGSDLQAAIRAADPGDLLKVRGTCTGSFDIDQDITLVGPATLSGGTCNEPYCDANQPLRGIVVSVKAGNVKLKKLVITDGYSTYEGGGIHNYGTLTLSSTAVRGNWAEDGAGGILNEGRLTMNWYSSVTDNYLLYGAGGGIWNRGTLIMNGWSRVEGNSATWGGGIYNQGTVIMNRKATVTANDAWDSGGGLLNDGGVVWYSPRWHGTLCGNTPDDWPTC